MPQAYLPMQQHPWGQQQTTATQGLGPFRSPGRVSARLQCRTECQCCRASYLWSAQGSRQVQPGALTAQPTAALGPKTSQAVAVSPLAVAAVATAQADGHISCHNKPLEVLLDQAAQLGSSKCSNKSCQLE